MQEPPEPDAHPADARPGDVVARAYDTWAATYDDDLNATRDLDAAVVRQVPLAVSGADVVELGCGTGKNTAWLAGRARSVVALDFSPGMLAKARARVPDAHVRFVEHDLRDAWPLSAESADVIVGNLVLEHLEQLPPVYAEAARVLRPGGALFLCELHPERQRRGGQAHFQDAATGERTYVPAFRHTIGEYVNSGIEAGLQLRRLGEWLEPGASPDAPPRLVSVLFEKA